jgi:catechol 2,3-dioxygenase-like lactoylglutathione lyase family enzyme
MTQIGGYIPATRKANVMGVHSLDHFSFAVPDLAKAEEFYNRFGLNTIAGSDHLELYAFGNSHRWGYLTEGDNKKLSYLSFGIFEDDLERFRKNLREQGVAELDAPFGLASNSIWIRDNNGILLELKVAEKSSPNEKSLFATLPSTAEGVRGAGFRRNSAIVQPRRLAHVLVFVRDVFESIKFYSRVLGLRLSDEAGGGVAFMHGVHGSDHHLVAFAKSDAPGFHHCSWDVGSIEEIGAGAMHMADKGYAAGWGLGRHVLGSNYFHYVRDPWGSYAEYSADIDYIPVTLDWQGESHAPEDSFYLWGPEPPKDFVFNYEAV